MPQPSYQQVPDMATRPLGTWEAAPDREAELAAIDGIEAVRRLVAIYGVRRVHVWISYFAAEQGVTLCVPKEEDR